MSSKTVHDLEQFNLKEMTQCGIALRKAGAGKASLEQVAQETLNYLFEHITSASLESGACSVARFFISLPWRQMCPELQHRANLESAPSDPDEQWLVLLASRGINEQWNNPAGDAQRLLVPLSAEETGKDAVLVNDLLWQLDIPPEKLMAKSSSLLDESSSNYNVVYVPDVVSAASIEAQDAFVIPNGVRSVVCYGGVLPSGNCFAVSLFLRIAINRQAALAFRPFALNSKIALLPFDQPELIFTRGTHGRQR